MSAIVLFGHPFPFLADQRETLLAFLAAPRTTQVKHVLKIVLNVVFIEPQEIYSWEDGEDHQAMVTEAQDVTRAWGVAADGGDCDSGSGSNNSKEDNEGGETDKA